MFGFKKRKNQEKGQDNAAESGGGWFSRLKQGLSKTRANLTDGLASMLGGQKTIDEDLLEEIETQLLVADIGIEATNRIIAELSDKLDRKELGDPEAVMQALRTALKHQLEPCSKPLLLDRDKKPFVILTVGVNGAGKTTTIGKLASHLKQNDQKVILAAGDTFRAAAVEQLQKWGERNDIPVVAQHTGADSASVIFDSIDSARSRNMDIVIADTAGRLHTQANLMEELKKVKRVIQKQDDSAPHEVLLVLDAGTGQNALNQAREFHQAVGVTGIVLTKLDGTAKGGVIFAIASQLGIPIRFIGVGEGIDDLQEFDPDLFIDALFG